MCIIVFGNKYNRNSADVVSKQADTSALFLLIRYKSTVKLYKIYVSNLCDLPKKISRLDSLF